MSCGLVAAGLLLPGPARAAVREEIECLALNLYFEARGEPVLGRLAVAHVVMNRVAHPRFPETVCGVVRQGGERPRWTCQFTWWCDGRSDRPEDKRAWAAAKMLAAKVYWGYSQDPTDGALWYHAHYTLPGWADALVRGPVIGQHIFYRAVDGPRGTQTADASSRLRSP